ncbi:MAG TPA: gamma-glutamylcyclotransferase family protein, partial [Polyangiaceae bacterium]|nr:gamma-glutamylcyclotransferase family protein [Polyangiaceae bacterium]
GERHHHRLGGAARITVCRTEPRYTLISLGPYPALQEGGATSVAGETYAVGEETLIELDRFEGVPDLYRRATVRLLGGDTAVAYVLAHRETPPRAPIPSGDWRRHSRSSNR